MGTVVYIHTIMSAVEESFFSTSTHEVVKNNGPSSLTICSLSYSRGSCSVSMILMVNSTAGDVVKKVSNVPK